ncbi:MAG TPA: hypothetical protein VKR32_10540 [Puia sp.]|nr:hypothetical protein [Puia sp.]
MPKTLAAFFVFAIFAGCVKSDLIASHSEAATIVGWNNGSCPFCGGFYLNLSADTTRNGNTCYVINYSESFNGTVDSLFDEYARTQRPISVLVSWQPVHVTNPAFAQNWLHLSSIVPR